MKIKRNIVVLGLIFLPAFALADQMPVVLNPILDFLKELFDFSKGLPGMSTLAILSGVLKLLIDATKTEVLGNFFDKLGPVGKGLLINGVSALIVGTTALAAGASLSSAFVAIVASSAGAVFLNEMWGLIKKALKIGQP